PTPITVPTRVSPRRSSGISGARITQTGAGQPTRKYSIVAFTTLTALVAMYVMSTSPTTILGPTGDRNQRAAKPRSGDTHRRSASQLAAVVMRARWTVTSSVSARLIYAA